MKTLVVARTYEVGHATVHDHEGLRTGTLYVKHLGHENPRLADDEPARFQNQAHSRLGNPRYHDGSQILHRHSVLFVVPHSVAPTQIQEVEVDPLSTRFRR